MVHVLNYGVGNLGSIVNMLKRVGSNSILVSRAEELLGAQKIILPGVGNFQHGMCQLKDSGMIGALNEKVLVDKIPILGICLGAQMMCNGSEEASVEGLSWFDAHVVKFNFNGNPEMRIPHMGWNFVEQRKESKLSANLPVDSRFYFVHSYHMVAKQNSDILYSTNYGYDFHSGLQKENIFACQFHPEKSHKFGIQMFKNFIDL